MSLPESARAVIAGANLAHMVTLNEDGSPQIACVWVGLDGDEIVSAHLMPQRKLENLRRDPRVSLSIEDESLSGIGLKQYVVVHGTARISEGGAPELLQELAHTYLGPDEKFPPMDDPPSGWIVHIAVERVGGNGPWT